MFCRALFLAFFTIFASLAVWSGRYLLTEYSTLIHLAAFAVSILVASLLATALVCHDPARP